MSDLLSLKQKLPLPDLLHHFSKGRQASKDVLDRMSGSGVFARDADAIFALTEHEEPNCYTVEAVLRNLPDIPPFVIERTFPLVTLRDDLDAYNLEGKPGREKAYSYQELLDLLQDGPLKSGAWQEMAEDELGMARATFHRYRDEMVVNGFVEEIDQTATTKKGKETTVKKWAAKPASSSDPKIKKDLQSPT